MRALRYGALFVLVAVVAIACGPAEETSSGPQAPSLRGQAISDVLQDEDVFILDVRTAAEIPQQGTIEGAVRIHIDELAGRLDELPKDRPILTL